MAYRNIYYDGKKGVVHLFTWDKDGERTTVECSYEPYLYLESQNGTDAKSIFNTALQKVSFKNGFERNKFVEETPLTRLFYNLNPDQQFLLDTFKDDVNREDYAKQPLKIFYIDIETYATDHFSTPQDANDPINLITVYDTLSKMYYTFGCNSYSTLEENVK